MTPKEEKGQFIQIIIDEEITKLRSIFEDELIIAKDQAKAFIDKLLNEKKLTNYIGLEFYSQHGSVSVSLESAESITKEEHKYFMSIYDNYTCQHVFIDSTNKYGYNNIDQNYLKTRFPKIEFSTSDIERIKNECNFFNETYVLTWIAKLWQSLNLNATPFFSIMRDYGDGQTFDLKQMRYINYDEEECIQGENTNYFEEELRLRTVKAKFDKQLFLKGNAIKEVGYIRENDVWKIVTKIYHNEIILEEKYTTYEKEEDCKFNLNPIVKSITEEGFVPTSYGNYPFILPFLPFTLQEKLQGSDNNWGKTSLEKIEELETRLSIKLPTDYKYFLQIYNGFTTHPYYHFGYSDIEAVNYITFFGICDNQHIDLLSNIERQNYHPLPDYLIIGEDKEFNQIWLNINNEVGKIIYNRYNHFTQSFEKFTIADSFQEFMDSFVYVSYSGLPLLIENKELDKIDEYISKHGDWEYETLAEDIFWYIKDEALIDFAISKGWIPSKRRLNFSSIKNVNQLQLIEKHCGILSCRYYTLLYDNIVKRENFNFNQYESLINYVKSKEILPQAVNTYESILRYYTYNPNEVNTARLSEVSWLNKQYTHEEIIESKILFAELKIQSLGLLGEDEIQNLETTLNIKLPDFYKIFLKRYNGAIISPNHFSNIDQLNIAQIGMRLEKLFSMQEIIFHYGNISSTLKEANNGRIALPIGTTNRNTFLCMDIEEKDGENTLWFLDDKYIDFGKNSSPRKQKPKPTKKQFSSIKNFLNGLLNLEQIFSPLQIKAILGDFVYYESRLASGFATHSNDKFIFQFALINNHLDLIKLFANHEAKIKNKKAIPNYEFYMDLAMKYCQPEMVLFLYDFHGIPLSKYLLNLKEFLLQHYNNDGSRDYLKDIT